MKISIQITKNLAGFSGNVLNSACFYLPEKFVTFPNSLLALNEVSNETARFGRVPNGLILLRHACVSL